MYKHANEVHLLIYLGYMVSGTHILFGHTFYTHFNQKTNFNHLKIGAGFTRIT